MKAIALEIARVNVFAKDFYVIPFKLSFHSCLSHILLSFSLSFSLILSLFITICFLLRERFSVYMCVCVCLYVCVKLYEAVKKLVRVIDQRS